MRKLIRGLLPALMLALLPFAAPASVAVGISVNFAPPALPVYVQPQIPAPGYIWTPGYWAWGPGGYYWVPGTWVLPPAVGFLWTPGYWGWVNGAYFWNAGYWGPHVGFYGGVNYGCGYNGTGYEGGYWHGNQFRYNNTVNNVRNIGVTNVYTRTVVHTGPVTRASFNGGAGGIVARPSPAELSAEHERHVAVTGAQREHESLAQGNNALRASVNGGRPPIAATSHPAVFTGQGVVAAPAPGVYAGSKPAHYAGEHTSQGEGRPMNTQSSGHAPYPTSTQSSGLAPYPTSTQSAGHAPYPTSTQSSGHAPYPTGTQYSAHPPYTASTQYPAHATSAPNAQYSGHAPSTGQPGAHSAHELQPTQQGQAGAHEPHGEPQGRR
jgi:hypothetical protein